MIFVRKGAMEDILILHDFNMRLAKETEDLDLDGDSLSRGLENTLADPTKARYFVAVDDEEGKSGSIVGCVGVTFEWCDWLNGWVWWLQNVYVTESHRKRGVFRLLFDSVMNMIEEDPSAKGLRLYANTANLLAERTYKALGMRDDHYKVFELMKLYN